jgi:long-subunit acyl-CoA synthetase (AMP-forming)
MSTPNTRSADLPLPTYSPNLASMLNANTARLGGRPIYQEVRGGAYTPLSWLAFRRDVTCLQNALGALGLRKGDRVAFLSTNRQEMLEMELAVMSMGAVSVPIFAGYSADQADALVTFCEPACVVVADADQYAKLKNPADFKHIIHFQPLHRDATPNSISFSQLLTAGTPAERIAGEDVTEDTVSLMMYTSGTMGKPKLVQLTHGNILSQQAAMGVLWKLDCSDRFLSYLPWHHSFGGIYERYSAICNGAVLSLEHGNGKNIDILLDNWRAVKPTVFFSVPRIYQQIVTRVLQDPALEREIFHDQLRFLFTAAAPLPKNISDLFEKRRIPVYEGWGLTETSPCCTVSDPKLARETGVVGKPIPGVTLRILEDGEILVKGPNVMVGYFHNPEATGAVLSADGWFSTGDVGEFTASGLKLISRKDRIFKLSNAEKVIPTEVENLIVEDCCYLSYAFLSGSGRDHPVVLLFPNKAMLAQRPEESRHKCECTCPGHVQDLAKCLSRCLKQVNERINAKYMRPKAAMLIDHELSIEGGDLTPSMKLSPATVAEMFKDRIEQLYEGRNGDNSQNVYIVDVEGK